ncbi:MAG TPA: beta-propeller domain-containing protein, partial [Polyangiales bacterium]|nr:beta-propeller domain-containing protein [Polyangiales bacterium]
MRQVRAGSLVALWLALAAVGCDDEAQCGDSQTPCASASSEGFESDLPPGAVASNEQNDTAPAAATSTSRATAQSTASAGSAEVAREIAEADIIQLQGGRLFALSRAAGLAVIDVSDPSALELLGRHRELPATPFEMYLKDGVALVMFTGWGQYVAMEDGSYDWVTTSKLVALDVQDPSDIQQLGSFDVPGSISDSRMVGDILYVVGHEDGYCWRCERDKPRTSIVSLQVADPRNVSKVDELFYEDANRGWGQRSVTVTSQRMYVAGPEYGQDMPTGSTIQVIDISDKDGDLVEGTSVTVKGQVDSRWQMDEYQGVLRVVSQPARWWTQSGPVTMKPAIETFTVESSQKLRALGRTDIELPPNDTLRSVRFDGERGYAITAEVKDPLFTLDLRDPAQPRVAGELTIPGFVYHMEPRGNRVLGLGFDRGNVAGGITVSLFDVSDMAKPTELSRVNFGGDWGSLPEDQDRIQKVFRVLDDKGFILVPFYGRSSGQRSDGSTCSYGEYVGGVQIIDFARDTLTARGAAPSEGVARRALLVDDALISVGDEQVEAFNIADRDVPERISQLVLSRTFNRAVQLDNGVVARVSSDYREGSVLIDFVNSADAEDPNRSEAALSLSELVGELSDRCEGALSVEQIFVRGTTLEVLYNLYRYRREGDQTMNTRGLLVLDASDAAN